MVTNSRLNNRINVFLIGFLLFFLMASDSDARDSFSIKLGLSCKQCHAKIPNLREFGQIFKNNGYSLENSVPSQTLPSTEQQPQAIAPSKTTLHDKSDKAPNQGVLALQQPDETQYPYRQRSKDGTYIFTDNPTNIDGTYIAVYNKGRDRRVKTNKSASSALKRVRHLKQDTALKNRVNTVNRVKQNEPISAVANSIAYRAEAQPRSFEVCMEKILIKTDQPKNGKEALEIFERAERSCDPYAAH